jgi:hypothetical protein
MAREINVCKDWNGSAKENFVFVNHNVGPVRVDKAPNSTWPFSLPPGFSVPGKTASGPGKQPCSLLDLPDHMYPYDVDGCTTQGQSKTVTIP